MKVFITGAEGFIGSHLVEELVFREHDVTALVNYNSFGYQGWLDTIPEETLKRVNVVMGDIKDSAFVNNVMEGHERVAHLAALIAIPYSFVAPLSYLTTNALGTLNVLEACRLNNIDRLIHTSTSEVYGTAQYVPIDESHPLVGQSPYAASKIAADQMAYSYWSSFSLPVVTIRPFNTYGPRQSQRAFIPSIIVQLLSGSPELRVGNLDPTRDFTLVSDTARGFATALESDGGLGETFNMGSGFEVSMGGVVDMLSDICGLRPSIAVDRARVRPETAEVERLWSDSSKMKEVFGWEPGLAGLDGLNRGLESTVEWFREHGIQGGYDSARNIL